MIATSTRLTTQRNVRIEPTRPRWVRVPRGSKTCAFCVMLASRGFAYLSEDLAGRQMQYHPDCDCNILPSWGSQILKDYDPDKFAEMHQTAKDAASSGDYRQVLWQMRQMYPDQVKDGT
ncbi:putative phage protein [Bifidobacterium bombi DSM 19703]|uniref:Putative phage protein n=1 Tax=Bifidobacterium bombi DSM 19703 TaxID=1341695 RepID=A0A080N2N4_9BIFI|nr:putative phage protein [Bifidobacterium bombi DSM 19703]